MKKLVSIISQIVKKSNHHKNLRNVSQMLQFRFLQVQIEPWNHRHKCHNETIHIRQLGVYCRSCLFEEKYKSFVSISVHKVSKCFLILFLSVIGTSTNRQRKGTLRSGRFREIPTLIENLLLVRICVVVSVHTTDALSGAQYQLSTVSTLTSNSAGFAPTSSNIPATYSSS
jgi:hypothetical protein